MCDKAAMEEMGVVADREVTSVRVNGGRDKKNKYRKKFRAPEEDSKMGDPKKRVKMGQDEPKAK